LCYNVSSQSQCNNYVERHGYLCWDFLILKKEIIGNVMQEKEGEKIQ